MAEELARLRIRIKGRVQGVGFRYSAVDEARRLALTGWVRNTSDGDVEVVAEGPKDRLQRLAAWCHIGPRGALVTDAEETWLSYTGKCDLFHIRH